MLYFTSRSYLQKSVVGLLLLWSITGIARADTGSEGDWQVRLQDLYQDIGHAYTDFVNSLENGGVLQDLKDWVSSFTSQPFSDRDTVQELKELASSLQSQVDHQQLSAEAQQQLNAFVDVVQTISGDISAGIAGTATLSDSDRLEALQRLETLHDGDQDWVNNSAQALAEKLHQQDVEGAMGLLQDFVDEYRRQQQSDSN